MNPYVEPWMRGTLGGSDPVLAALLYSFQHAREDLDKWTADLSPEQLWREHGACASVGFHIRHIGGSIERLLTYARGEQLTGEQLEALKREGDAGMTRDELLAELDAKLKAAEDIVRGLDSAALNDTREIGRKRIPVPLGTLLVHIAEHTQRHVGEAIITSKIVR